MSTFNANGLLGLEQASDTVDVLSDFTLESNGLLEISLPNRVGQETNAIENDGREGTIQFHDENTAPEISSMRDCNPNYSTESGPRIESPLMSFKSTGLLAVDGSSGGNTTSSKRLSFGMPSGLNGPPSANTIEERTSALSIDKCISARTFDGKTIHFRRKSKKRGNSQHGASSSSAICVGSLLEVPIHRMLDDLSANVAAKLQQPEQESASSVIIDDFAEHTLWVDRYRPSRFTELVGNERVARDTLAWVKQWDWCVFGRRPKGKAKAETMDDNLDPDDPYHRPQQKIMLLSGPPGLGKTTLAHVVARQAGYEVMEINASDARTGFVVEERIRPALESGSAIGSKKPVLLVIDEIDGATGAGENSTSFISKLLQLIQYKPKKTQRASATRGPKTKSPILRPVICICNDANASALARLRPVACHLRYSRPADAHVVNRLRHICEAEGLKVESRALNTLVGVARGDLRGCLNTLQFIKTQNEDVTETVIRRATIGMKEADLSVNTILTDLFSPMSKKRVQELGLTSEEETRYVGRLSREIEGSERESTIAVGCFTHYPRMRQHDANFLRYESANEWLLVYEQFSAAMYSDGDFALLQYLPYTLVPFYPLFSERGSQVERSQTDWEQVQLMRTNEEIYKSMSRGLRNSSANSDYRRLLTRPTLQLEFAPYINRIISPPIRPINSQVIRPEERAVLKRLVDIMIALDLRFLQERTEDGQLTYRLDPPIDVFVTYDGKRAADIAPSRYAVRQLIVTEIDAQITRGTIATEGNGSVKRASTNETTLAKRGTNHDGDSGPPNKRARIAADTVPLDFFGRPITQSQSKISEIAEVKKLEKKFRVTYRYTEGNSAAVRKPVKVASFL
ncbi:hypothetical protein AX17_002887 [Amanita inopinata Kibby_2008]|nr:hypothetical protein AX17_002887 [Amanita inopinata Kibby_2008]